VSREPDAQPLCCLTVAHADAVTASGLSKKKVTLIQSQQRRWCAMTGAGNERMTERPHHCSASRKRPSGIAGRNAKVAARDRMSRPTSASQQSRQTPHAEADTGLAIAGVDKSNAPTLSRFVIHCEHTMQCRTRVVRSASHASAAEQSNGTRRSEGSLG